MKHILYGTLILGNLFLVSCQKDSSFESTRKISGAGLFSDKDGNGSIANQSRLRGVLPSGFSPVGGSSAQPNPVTGGSFSSIGSRSGQVYSYTPSQSNATYRPSSVIYNPSSSTSSSYLRPHYDYGHGQMDHLLAYADYVHGGDPTILSVVRLTFGRSENIPFANQENGSRSLSLAAESDCWEFNVSSSNADLSLLAVKRSTKRNNGVTQTNSQTIRVTACGDPSMGRGGIVFAVHTPVSEISCPEYFPLEPPGWGIPSWYQGQSDPWSSGFQGSIGQSSYFYPPHFCSQPYSARNLRVSGRQYSSGPTIYPISRNFDHDLSSYINSYAGYFPLFEENGLSENGLRARFVNFDRWDWR